MRFLWILSKTESFWRMNFWFTTWKNEDKQCWNCVVSFKGGPRKSQKVLAISGYCILATRTILNAFHASFLHPIPEKEGKNTWKVQNIVGYKNMKFNLSLSYCRLLVGFSVLSFLQICEFYISFFPHSQWLTHTDAEGLRCHQCNGWNGDYPPAKTGVSTCTNRNNQCSTTQVFNHFKNYAK